MRNTVWGRQRARGTTLPDGKVRVGVTLLSVPPTLTRGVNVVALHKVVLQFRVPLWGAENEPAKLKAAFRFIGHAAA